jgi:5-enolpyruvylshikimate-3-phosphate synthase
MNIFTETLALTLLFLLRLGVPIAVTGAIVWGLRRLDARWQVEADAQRASRAVAAGLLSSTSDHLAAGRRAPLLAAQQLSARKAPALRRLRAD